MKKVIFDCGEMGWAILHRAHLQWLKEHNELDDIEVWTLQDRKRLYEEFPVVIKTNLPDSIKTPKLVRNSFLYNNGPNIRDIFIKCGIDPVTVIHGWNGLEWKSDDCYKDKMIFIPLSVTEEEMNQYYEKLSSLIISRLSRNIIFMPRCKMGDSYTEYRNWGMDNWRKLDDLCSKYLDVNIIFCGKYGESYFLRSTEGKSINLISIDPFVDTLCALADENTIMSVSSQSFMGKLSLLQNKDTLMWGHQKQRHQIDENWSSKDGVKCFFVESLDYKVSPEEIYGLIYTYIQDRSDGDCC